MKLSLPALHYSWFPGCTLSRAEEKGQILLFHYQIIKRTTQTLFLKSTHISIVLKLCKDYCSSAIRYPFAGNIYSDNSFCKLHLLQETCTLVSLFQGPCLFLKIVLVLVFCRYVLPQPCLQYLQNTRRKELHNNYYCEVPFGRHFNFAQLGSIICELTVNNTCCPWSMAKQALMYSFLMLLCMVAQLKSCEVKLLCSVIARK